MEVIALMLQIKTWKYKTHITITFSTLPQTRKVHNVYIHTCIPFRKCAHVIQSPFTVIIWQFTIDKRQSWCDSYLTTTCLIHYFPLILAQVIITRLETIYLCIQNNGNRNYLQLDLLWYCNITYKKQDEDNTNSGLNSNSVSVITVYEYITGFN